VAQLVLEHVEKVYPNGCHAVHDLRLTADPGGVLVLVGPSGAGKTTVLRLIAGLEPITQGAVFLAGRPIHDLAPANRNLAMVFQTPALYPHKTACDNMAFSLAMRGIPKRAIRNQVLQAAALLGIDSRTSFRADRRSAWPWAGPLCADRIAFSSTNRSPASMRGRGSLCAPSSKRCSRNWESPQFT
jgi:ABC-type sugar transport system ATPase subunit